LTEAELTTRIAEVEDAIHRMLLLGKEYEVGSGPTKRIFKAEDLDRLTEYKAGLESQLLAVQGSNGLLAGF